MTGRRVWRHLPNALTVLRLLAVPIHLLLILSGHLDWAFWLFLLAGATDAADGAIARVFDLRSRLGRILDPIADKALLVTTYAALGVAELLPAWLIVIVVARDMLLIAGFLVLSRVGRPVTIRPLLIGKLGTGAQIALAAAVLATAGLGLELGTTVEVLIWAVAAVTVASAGAYALRGAKAVARGPTRGVS